MVCTKLVEELEQESYNRIDKFLDKTMVVM